MWWPQTMKGQEGDRRDGVDHRRGPEQGLREKVGKISEMMPKAGRIMM